MNTPSLAWRAATVARAAAGWRTPWLRRWPGVLAGVVMLLLLSAFQAVVRDIVRSSELRHAAVLVQANATWRCKLLAHRGEREACLRGLEVPRRVSTPPAAEP